MSGKAVQISEPGLAKEEDALAELKRKATGSKNSDVQAGLLSRLITFLQQCGGSKDEQQTVDFAIRLLEEIAPRDSTEGMLASQMIATHDAALKCLIRAEQAEQSFEGRQFFYDKATKLLQLYIRQLEALDKHRGKGQQKITVEHVHVEAGGQAIVGDVHAGATKALPRGRNTPALADHSQAETLAGNAMDELSKPRIREARRRR